MNADPLTPVAVEQKLRSLVTELPPPSKPSPRRATSKSMPATSTSVQSAGPSCSDKSPKVARGGYTVAEQTAWVEEQCADLSFAAGEGRGCPGRGAGPAARAAGPGRDRQESGRVRPAGVRNGGSLGVTVPAADRRRLEEIARLDEGSARRAPASTTSAAPCDGPAAGNPEPPPPPKGTRTRAPRTPGPGRSPSIRPAMAQCRLAYC